jgi:3-methyl-2-oxobutanoate hydroxymethyltransferase
MTSVLEFQRYKNRNKPISVLTCYDYWSAKIIDETNIDAVLVGDSVSMVMHGYDTTVNANLEMMKLHVAAVRKGLKNKFLIADMPFLSHRKGLKELIESVDDVMKSGAQAVKIEGANGHIEAISHVVGSGVPVMGHIGLTPQSVHQLGGFKVQGKNDKQAQQLIDDAKSLEHAGCFAIVLEMVPSDLAKTISEIVSVPTIGIGAGEYTDGQVLVLQDMLGMDKDFTPKFLKKYLNGYEMIKSAINDFDSEVKEKRFPTKKESF